MDYSGFRRSTNVEQPQPTLDHLWAMAMNPYNSQWRQFLPTGLAGAQTAADWPTFPQADPRLAQSGMAQQLGSQQLPLVPLSSSQEGFAPILMRLLGLGS